MGFAELLRDARVSRGWSKARLADVSGIDRSLVSRIENGVQPGSVRTISRLASVLGIDLNRLRDEDPDLVPTEAA